MSNNDSAVCNETLRARWRTVPLLVLQQEGKKNCRSVQPQRHIIAKTTDAIDLGESTVSYPVSSSPSTLHEALGACSLLSRGQGAVL